MVGLGFLQPVSYIKKSKSQPTTNDSLWRKVAQKPNFNTNFYWAGSAMGWGVRRFHNNIYNSCFPAPQNSGNRKHPLFFFPVILFVRLAYSTAFSARLRHDFFRPYRSTQLGLGVDEVAERSALEDP